MSAVITGELTRRGRGPWASKLPLVSRPRRRGDRIRSATSAHDPSRTLGRSVWGRLAALSHPTPRRKVLGLMRRRGFPSGGRMRRRDFMAGSAATAAVGVGGWPVRAEINAGSPVPKRIALVHPNLPPEQLTSSSGRRAFKAYFQELDRLGYIEGKNLVVERYSVLGRHYRTEEIARGSVGSRPVLILAMS